MHSIYCENIDNLSKFSNERTQIAFNEYDFIIYNKKDLYNIKRTKKENNNIF